MKRGLEKRRKRSNSRPDFVIRDNILSGSKRSQAGMISVVLLILVVIAAAVIIIAFIMSLTIMLIFILFKARYIYLKE